MKKMILFILFILGMAISSTAYAAAVQWSGNGHQYDFIVGGLSWNNAAAQAEASGGYLATVTSAEENQFLLSNFATGQASNFAWIGGYQYDNLAEPAGHWRWVTDESWSYTNWGGVEPSNTQVNEDYAMFNIGSTFAGVAPGQWADAIYIPNTADPTIGYFVEYEDCPPIPEPSSLLILVTGLIPFLRRKLSK